jgi:hypothetical protein
VIAIEITTQEAYLEATVLLDPFGYICTGSFNYTPTHIFACPTRLNKTLFLKQLSHRLALHYIASTMRQRSLNQWVAALQARLSGAAEANSAAQAAFAIQQAGLKATIDELASKLSAVTEQLSRLKRRIGDP